MPVKTSQLCEEEEPMKKILVMALSVAIIATLAISGTVAYLTDMDSAVNVMTTGNVFIKQYEDERVMKDGAYVEEDDKVKLQTYTNGQQIVPAVYDEYEKEDLTVNGYTFKMRSEMNGKKSIQNYVDKIVTVENTGTADAYVRTIIAIPEALVSDTNEESGFKGFDTTVLSDASEQWLHWNYLSDSDTENKNGWFWGRDVEHEWHKENDGTTVNDWYFVNNVTIKVDGKDGVYDLYVVTNKNVIKPKEKTAPNLLGFYVDKRVDNELLADGTINYYFYDSNDTKHDLGDITDLNILVATQAVQADGFTDAWTALDDAFDPITSTNHPWTNGVNLTVADNAADLQAALMGGKNVVLTKDITTAASEAGVYNNIKVGYIQNGGVFDGGNKTLTVTGTGTYGIQTSGGTIKNVAIKAPSRGVVINAPTEDVIIDNLTIGADAKCVYTLNTAEHATKEGLKLQVSNSTLCGWTSFAGGFESASFTNTDFGSGTFYSETNDLFNHLVKPYISTTFTNCTFCEDFYLDLSELGAGCTVTFVNCKVNGTTITAANIGSSVFGNVELPSESAHTDDTRTISDLVIVRNS